MCYPSETQGNHTFIPQWTMWYILEVEEHINRCGHEAERVAKEAVRRSFDGRTFLDHAVREEGGLRLCRNCSETCQYYAILFGGVDLREPAYAELKHPVPEVFRADRTELLEEIIPVNAFIGAYLRLDVLLKLGENQRVLESLSAFFGDMVEKTGTLWELRQCRASLDHGFASYALVAMRRALGIDG